jgi:L-ascorbate metabolism protein UlaG (beta-lactamase superfamily)
VLSTPAAAQRLRRWGFDGAAGMATWESTMLSADDQRLTITAVPGQHARGLARSILPPVMGSVLELARPGRPPFRVYVSGDTLYFPWLSSIVERTGPLDAAVVHLGGTRLLGLLVTMDDRQGADLVARLEPKVVVPVHHDDYGVFKSPLADFVATFEERGLPGALRVVRRGETVSLEP